ncbi:hypothetical protein M758_UG251900, partial [Ceratodon purpureus]
EKEKGRLVLQGRIKVKAPPAYHKLVGFLRKHCIGRSRLYKGSSKPHPCVDLILVDIPEGLPIPGISNPADSIPPWNQDSKMWLNPIFEFAEQHLSDDGAMILFHPFRVTTRSNMLGYLKTWSYEIRKEWWGMNHLHLTSGTNPLLTTQRFGICLAILKAPTSNFKFQTIPALDWQGVNVAVDDILPNIVTREEHHMNGDMAWRGPREK